MSMILMHAATSRRSVVILWEIAAFNKVVKTSSRNLKLMRSNRIEANFNKLLGPFRLSSPSSPLQRKIKDDQQWSTESSTSGGRTQCNVDFSSAPMFDVLTQEMSCGGACGRVQKASVCF